MLSLPQNNFDKVIDIEKYAQGSILTDVSDGKLFDYRKMHEHVKRLERALTEEEAEQYRIE